MNIYKNLLKGKKGVILGVANKMSIAWGIAEALNNAGAQLVLTYQERLKSRVEALVDTLESDSPVNIIECDVSSSQSIEQAFTQISELYNGSLDFIVHSVAFAQREDLLGRYIDTSRENYALAQDISAYSLVAVAKYAEPLLIANGGGSILTMSYIGGERIVQNYNVMGVAKAALECSVKYLANDLGKHNIRVNAISAGPIKTLASSAIGGISSMLKEVAEISPLRRNVDPSDVAGASLFFVSDLSKAITAEVVHVDSGFHAMAASKS